MKINYGTPSNFYSQLNDATYFLLKGYNAESNAVACGTNAVLCGMEINNWLTKKYNCIWGKGIQKTDAYMIMINNPENEFILDGIDAGMVGFPRRHEYSPYLTMINYFYEKKIINHAWSVSIDLIIEHLKNHQMVIVNKPGHYVCIHGVDTEKEIFYYADSYNKERGINYFNREMSYDYFENKVKKYKNLRLWIEHNKGE
jgi:hypothetical protein